MTLTLAIVGVACLQTLIPHSGRGSAVIFSSCLNHRVTPVSRGLRKSLVQWVRSSEPRPRSSAEVWNAFREGQQALEESIELYKTDRTRALKLIKQGISDYGVAIRDHPEVGLDVDLRDTTTRLHNRHALPKHILAQLDALGVTLPTR